MNRCHWCPHEADRHQPPPISETHPFTHLACGHTVHLQCLLFATSRDWVGRVKCPECNEPLLSPEVVRYMRDRENGAVTDIGKLWEENETFREQIQEAAKLERLAIKKRSVFRNEVIALQQEWKEKTSSYKSILKNMKDSFLKRFRELPGKRDQSLATGKANRMKRTIRDTYDLAYYELERLRDVQGAPKIGMMGRPWRRFLYPEYMFRLRI